MPYDISCDVGVLAGFYVLVQRVSVAGVFVTGVFMRGESFRICTGG